MDMISEILPLIGGGFFGALFKLYSLKMHMDDERQKALINIQAKTTDSVQQDIAKGGSPWIRRIIAIAITLTVCYIATYPIFQPVNVMVDHTVGSKMLFGLIDTTHIEHQWQALRGSVVLPALMPSFECIIGAYFGANIVDRR